MLLPGATLPPAGTPPQGFSPGLLSLQSRWGDGKASHLPQDFQDFGIRLGGKTPWCDALLLSVPTVSGRGCSSLLLPPGNEQSPPA